MHSLPSKAPRTLRELAAEFDCDVRTMKSSLAPAVRLGHLNKLSRIGRSEGSIYWATDKPLKATPERHPSWKRKPPADLPDEPVRVIVDARKVPPLLVRGPRSVFDLGRMV